MSNMPRKHKDPGCERQKPFSARAVGRDGTKVKRRGADVPRRLAGRTPPPAALVGPNSMRTLLGGAGFGLPFSFHRACRRTWWPLFKMKVAEAESRSRW